MKTPRLTPTRSLALLVALTCLLLFAIVPRYGLLDEAAVQHASRAIAIGEDPPQPADPPPSAPPSASTPAPTTPPATPSAPPSSSSSSSPPSSSPPPPPPPPPPSSSSSSSSSTPPASASDPPPSSPSNGAPSTPAPTTPTPTDPAQQSQTNTNVVFQTDPASASTSPTPSAPADNSDDDNGISTSTIVGLSVAGGVAVLGIIAFFVWKFTRKRFSDLDDNEAIKWPELNAHGDTGVPLPVNRTGGAGFDTASEADHGYAGSVAATSTTELYPGGGADPYAVPPLPHLNPNQPYRDDPTEQFYDPYRGPVPQTFDAAGEAIPMTQLAGRRSPGPGAAYDYPAGGRTSPGPGPQAGRRSPGPQAAYGYGDPNAGRVSPGPQAAYGYGGANPNAGRMSPGPQAAYNAGRASPGPQAAYGPQ